MIGGVAAFASEKPPHAVVLTHLGSANISEFSKITSKSKKQGRPLIQQQ